MFIVLNGPLGIGKSTLAEALCESIDQCVMLDGDHVVATNPVHPDSLTHLHSTLALLVQHHRRFGYRHFVIDHFWQTPAELADLRRHLGAVDSAGEVRCFLLTLPLDENLMRIRRRQSARALDEREFELQTVAEERNALSKEVRMNPFVKLNRQYIAGEWRDGASAKVVTDRNPYNGKPICDFKLADKADVDVAYRSAAAAQKIWAQVNPFEKRAILEKAITFVEKNEAEITDILIEELGGTGFKAFFEIGVVKNIIKEAATYPLRMNGEILPSTVDGKENRLYRVPVGVVGVISPFNAPFFLSMRSVATALGAGNGVVLKPHDDTPITGGTLVARVFEEAGLPKGLLNVVVADVREIGDAFVEHPIPRVISFTGSEGVGRQIGGVAGRCLKKAVLELGGNSALIVLADADVERALNAAVFSRFTHQGQICMSANRVLVHRSLYANFLEKYVKRVSGLKVGDPRDPKTDIGPLMNKAQADTLSKQIQKGVDEGARVALRGKVEGTMASPTVFADVKPGMSVAQCEMFGPAVSVIPFDTPEEAIRIANDSAFGLSGAIHTKDVEYGAELAKQIDSGAIHVNDGTINDEPLVAFGGEKASGTGRLNGKWALEEFTTLKWISVQHAVRHYPFEPQA